MIDSETTSLITPEEDPNKNNSQQKSLIQDIHNKFHSTKHPKLKASLVLSMLVSGALVPGAAGAYVYSDEIINWFSKNGNQMVDKIPELVVPRPLPELDKIEGLITAKSTALPDITEINTIIDENPALKSITNFGRRPVTINTDNGVIPEIITPKPPVVIEPEIIKPPVVEPEIVKPPVVEPEIIKPPVDPETLSEIRDVNSDLDFLKNPEIMGAIAGGALGIAIIAAIIFSIVKIRENKNTKELLENAKILNDVLQKNNGNDYGDLRNKLNESIGDLKENRKLDDLMSELRTTSTVSESHDSSITYDGFSNKPTERLKQLIEAKNKLLREIEGIQDTKGNSTKSKTFVRKDAKLAIKMINEEIIKTAKIISDIIEPEATKGKIKSEHSKKQEIFKQNFFNTHENTKNFNDFNADLNTAFEKLDRNKPSTKIKAEKSNEMSMSNPVYQANS